MKRFIQVQLFLLIALFNAFGLSAQAQTIFQGSTEEGEVIGLCLNPEGTPQCDDVDCKNPEFRGDIRCISESEAGTELAEGSLSSTGIPTNDTVAELVIKLINFALPYLALGAFIAFIVAAFLYVTNFGDEEQTQKAKKIMIWALVGILIVIASYTIVQFFTEGLIEQL